MFLIHEHITDFSLIFSLMSHKIVQSVNNFEMLLRLGGIFFIIPTILPIFSVGETCQIRK